MKHKHIRPLMKAGFWNRSRTFINNQQTINSLFFLNNLIICQGFKRTNNTFSLPTCQIGQLGQRPERCHLWEKLIFESYLKWPYPNIQRQIRGTTDRDARQNASERCFGSPVKRLHNCGTGRPPSQGVGKETSKSSLLRNSIFKLQTMTLYLALLHQAWRWRAPQSS